MLRKLLFFGLVLVGMLTNLQANKNTAKFYAVDGNIENRFHNMVENDLKDVGFVVADPHKGINNAYKDKYGSTTLDSLSFMTIVNPKVVSPLLNIDPRLAGFNPFNLLLYKEKGDDKSYLGHLEPEAILDMLNIQDSNLRDAYINSFKLLDKKIENEFGKNLNYRGYSKIIDKPTMNFEMEFDRPEDLDDFIDEFQEAFEEKFEENKYIIAGYFNFKDSLDGVDRLKNFDAFWTYSLCHFKFSYNTFDTAGAKPEAGVFAPCTMYMYIKKDSNKLVVGMPRLHNWANMLNISDDKRIQLIKDLDTEIPAIMKELGAKEVDAPVAAIASSKNIEVKKTIIPSNAGYIRNGKVSAYLRGEMASVEDVESALENGGFKVLANMSVDKKSKLKTILFTNDELIKMSSQSNRGFSAVMRVLIDEINNQISITNPLYFSKAFLQDNYNKKLATSVLKKINNSFSKLKDSKDYMDFDDLNDYHFMMGMPYYEDMEILAKGSNQDLIKRLQSSGDVIFTLNIQSSTVVGVQLGKRTSKFVSKIGVENASVLPYLVLIENGKAKVLAPKYYLAVSYPLLKMNQFMKIATVPGAILKDIKKMLN